MDEMVGQKNDRGELKASRFGLAGRVLRALGPGLVTGAADDDPSGIATYSQVGAQFGYQLSWILLFSYPLMAVTQAIAARIGCVTGRGIAQNLRRHYPRWLLRIVVLLLLVANVANLGADLGAMGSAVQLLVGGPALVYTVILAGFCVLFQIFMSYARYASVLKWLTLSLFSYVVVVIAVDVPWGEALKNIFVPSVSFDSAHAMAVVAVLGTTISPYLFFWQAGQEVEEQVRRATLPLYVTPGKAGAEMERMGIDTWVGMGLSNLISLFIVLATAATLHAHGVTDINSSAQAAEALRPIAGRFAFTIFALGIIGTGLLALPVLAGSAAYAVGEALHWRVGLVQRPGRARAFYGTIAVATFVGALLNFSPLDPIKALFWSAVINGVAAVPIMVMIMLMASRRQVMGQFTLTPWLMCLGWLATAAMAAAAIGMFATWGD